MHVLKIVKGADLKNIITTIYSDYVPRIGEQICINEIDEPCMVTNVMSDYRGWQDNARSRIEIYVAVTTTIFR
jgi:hypothetical protein